MYTGTRRNEAIALEWNDINRTEKLIQIKGTKTETSARNILLTDEVETILNGQKKQNEERGIKGRRVFPYSAQQASRHFKTLCPEPPFARTSAHVYNTVRGKRRKRERLPTTCRTRKRGYDDKRIYARNGRIQKKRSGEIFAFSYVLNGRKIHV